MKNYKIEVYFLETNIGIMFRILFGIVCILGGLTLIYSVFLYKDDFSIYQKSEGIFGAIILFVLGFAAFFDAL